MAVSEKKGIKVVLLWRLLEDAATKKAIKLAFQEEHSVEASIEGGETKQTKDGIILTEGNVEETIPFKSTMANNDDTAKMLIKAFYDQNRLELWEVDLNEKDSSGEYAAEYRQGKLTDITKTAGVDNTVVLEGTFKTEGNKQEGTVELTAEQEAVVQYAFRDTNEYVEPVTP